MLPVITPFYCVAKTCLLVWGASSVRPYGGRLVLDRAFKAITNTNDPLTNGLATTEEFAAQAGVPPRVFRLAVAAVACAAGTIAIGICFWIVCAVENVFSSRPTWFQAKACVIAGACWPLYATCTCIARTWTDATAGDNGGGHGGGGRYRMQRQGPAAVRWLSYWPMFALFLAVLNPVIGWIPHYYTLQLVGIAYLALPQTRGAYLITSWVSRNQCTPANTTVVKPSVAMTDGHREDTTAATFVPVPSGAK